MEEFRMKDHRASFARRERAQSMVEFALVLPVLLLLIIGIIEFGRMLFVYSVVYTASREAARYGSAAGENGSGVPNYLDCDGIKAAAQRVAILANIKPIIIAYDEGADVNGDPINRTIGCPKTGIEGGFHRVSVDVIADYSPIIPLPALPSTFQIRSESARTIIGDVPIGVFLLPGLYVYDLAGYGENNLTGPPRWKAHIDVQVNDFKNMAMPNATVTIEWPNSNQYGVCDTTGEKGICQCTTDLSGICSMDILDIQNNRTPITFIVTNITHSTPVEYDFSSNIESTITICRPGSDGC